MKLRSDRHKKVMVTVNGTPVAVTFDESGYAEVSEEAAKILIGIRQSPAEYEVVAMPDVEDLIDAEADEPNEETPIVEGTDTSLITEGATPAPERKASTKGAPKKRGRAKQ